MNSVLLDEVTGRLVVSHFAKKQTKKNTIVPTSIIEIIVQFLIKISLVLGIFGVKPVVPIRIFISKESLLSCLDDFTKAWNNHKKVKSHLADFIDKKLIVTPFRVNAARSLGWIDVNGIIISVFKRKTGTMKYSLQFGLEYTGKFNRPKYGVDARLWHKQLISFELIWMDVFKAKLHGYYQETFENVKTISGEIRHDLEKFHRIVASQESSLIQIDIIIRRGVPARDTL